MAKNRCSLCDGRLNSEGRCVFCGLDNTKSDRYYRLNQSNCDDASFTHVHEDDGSVKSAKRILRQSSPINGTGKSKMIREADWEINHKQAQKKYQDMNNQRTDARTAASSYTKAKRTDYGMNGDDYMKRSKRIRKIVIILVIVGLLLQIVPALIISYSPEVDNIRHEIGELFGSGSEEIIGDRDDEFIYQDPKTGDIIDFDDEDALEEFLEENGWDYFGDYGWDEFDDEIIEPEEIVEVPSDGTL